MIPPPTMHSPVDRGVKAANDARAMGHFLWICCLVTFIAFVNLNQWWAGWVAISDLILGPVFVLVGIAFSVIGFVHRVRFAAIYCLLASLILGVGIYLMARSSMQMPS